MIGRIKGTQDWLDLSLYRYVIAQAQKQMQRYQFTEIATPLIEPVALFKRTLGTDTDVVSKEMFCIRPHSETSEEICLRPEATASTMRAYLQERVTAKPWRVYSYGPCFRYERPQKGRLRQFTQFNIELINASSISYDAQCLFMLNELFSQGLNLSSYTLHINFLGCKADRATYRTTLLGFLTAHQADLCSTCAQRMHHNTMRIFDCKEASCQAHYVHAPLLVDHMCQECVHEWSSLQQLLNAQNVPYTITPTLVRGLDYYEKTVFEFVSTLLGAQSTFCGGGRYELASIIGDSDRVPSLGAAFGMERMLIMLQESGMKLPVVPSPVAWIIIPLSPAQHAYALAVANTLRNAEIFTTILFDGTSLKTMLRNAHAAGAPAVIIIGEDEEKADKIVFKNLETGDQKVTTVSDLISTYASAHTP